MDTVRQYGTLGIVITVVIVITQLGLFMSKGDMYRDFVSKTQYNQDYAALSSKLDYIITRMDTLSDRGRGR